MKLIIITDVHAEWHPEHGSVAFVVEFADGQESTIANVMPEKEPSFASAVTDEEFECSDYQEWYNEALDAAHRQGYWLEGEVEGSLAMKCYIAKQAFVDKLSNAIGGQCSGVDAVTYEVFRQKKTGYYQEYVVMHYRGGAIAVRTVNGTSHSGILREIAKMVDGGYYEEVDAYKSYQSSPDWYKFL